MKFTNGANTNGTHLQGNVNCTYHELVEVFGMPDVGPDATDQDKVTCEWCLVFADGTVATIYDWKLPHTPGGYYDWHIGGTSYRAVELVQEAMINREPLYKMVRDYEDEHYSYHGA